MTTAAITRDAPAATARPPLLTGPLLLRLISVIGSSVSFYLPLSVVPRYVASSGPAAAAGLATGALLLATVLSELITPRLVARVGYRLSLTVGLVLLGAPALALLASSSLAVVVTVSIIRGIGFAITTVGGGALTASLIPAQRRGEGLGLVGIAAGVPSLVSLPAGVWVSAHWGYSPVFAATAAWPARPPCPPRPRWPPALMIGGAACFGTGFGFLQNATLAMMYARSPRAGYSTVSALWNAAYDTGMAAGPIGIGLIGGRNSGTEQNEKEKHR
jgi:hypothetical protein